MPGTPYQMLRSSMDSMHAFQNLYNVYNDPSKKGYRNQLEYRFSSYPIVGDYIRNRDAEKYLSDYMRNRNLTWDDVKYPGLLKGSTLGYNTYKTSIKAVKRLYD